MPAHPPLLLVPRYVVKPWGGRRLETVLGRTDLPDGLVGESWEVVDVGGTCSVVDGGPFDGRTLRDVLGEPFPLLLKVLDAHADLSVQVHPDGADGTPAKEEAWVALADAGAVAVGSGPPDTPPGAWLDRLDRVRLAAGAADVPPSLIHVPPGTVHAILAGALVFEIQNPVDVTWRLYDYDRPGVDGRPRALHPAEAGDVLARGPEAAGRTSADGTRLEGTRFAVTLLEPGRHEDVRARAAFLPAGGEIGWEGGSFRVPPGRTVVLPGGPLGLDSAGWAVLAEDRATP